MLIPVLYLYDLICVVEIKTQIEEIITISMNIKNIHFIFSSLILTDLQVILSLQAFALPVKIIAYMYIMLKKIIMQTHLPFYYPSSYHIIIHLQVTLYSLRHE